jgi:hypothetical protein
MKPVMTAARPLLDDTFPLPLDAPFTRSMATAAGISDNTLSALCDQGFLRRPLRSVYVAAQVPDSRALRIAVLELSVPPGCFVTDDAAAWLHAGNKALPPNSHLELGALSVFRPPEAGRLRNEITRSGERTLGNEDLMRIGALSVTTPLRTALDLGRLQKNHDYALWGMDCMLGTGAFSLDELLSEVPRFRRQRGVVQLRRLAPLADGLSQSFGESALRLRWLAAGLPRPRLQIPVVGDGRVIYWLDMGLEELLFAAEYDGEAFHSSPDDRKHDQERRAWLRTRRSWVVEEFRQTHVFGTRQDATETLAAAYREARRTLGCRTTLV